jgi:hypothetical protein
VEAPSQDMAGRRVLLVYIGSSMRSGSTLLSELIGSRQGAISIGELTDIWGALRDDARCACGARVSECVLWSEVMRQLRTRRHIEVGDLSRLQIESTRAARWAGWWSVLRHRMRRRSSAEQFLLDCTQELLLSVRDVTGANLIVDSTKHGQGFFARRELSAVDTRLVHLVRDPRAVVASDLRSKAPTYPPAEMPPGRPVGRSVIHWDLTNLLLAAARAATKGSLVRYEELTRAPGEVLDKLDLPPSVCPRPEGASPAIVNSHILVGNPVRHQKGPRPIVEDARWRSELPDGRRLLISVAALPVWWLVTRRFRMDRDGD